MINIIAMDVESEVDRGIPRKVDKRYNARDPVRIEMRIVKAA